MDMGNLLQQARQMHEKMTKIQDDLALKTITGESGGGMARVTINGRRQALSVEIEPALLVASEKKMLEDLLVAAMNDALRKADELNSQEMRRLTGGMTIPGLSNLF
ncbi:MAG: YbaB/EbfC family nucleoid-associated protein [Desulfobulbaceae bacterium]|jgi:DNA-binding YbaB/EbfC family protein|nr:YbaB/EbfC family nucleoid-associated protein [Desulfobulbaceae bacterium]